MNTVAEVKKINVVYICSKCGKYFYIETKSCSNCGSTVIYAEDANDYTLDEYIGLT